VGDVSEIITDSRSDDGVMVESEIGIETKKSIRLLFLKKSINKN